MKVYSILIVLAIFLAQDCNNRTTDSSNTNDTPVDLGEKRVLIVMKKNPCFGKCPFYEVTIYTDGYVEFDGFSYTEKLGKYSKNIPTVVVAGLYKEFEKIGFMQMPEKHPSKLHDLQKTRITFHPDATTSHHVSGDSFRPEELLALDKKLTEIANAEGWTLIEKAKDENGENLANHIIRDQIIAKFHKGIDIPNYVHSHMDQYGLNLVRRVAPNLNMYVLTFDTLKVKPTDMLIFLKESKEVEEAEFNKKLTNRKRN